jgi:hypothetical protein
MITTSFNIQNEGLSTLMSPHKPIKIKNNIMVPKPRSEYTDGDKKLLFMDAKYFVLVIE